MNAFSIDFVSPASYENLAVEISFSGQILCRISTERSDGILEVEFLHDHRMLSAEVLLKFPIKDFLVVFNQACDDLKAASNHDHAEGFKGDGGN